MSQSEKSKGTSVRKGAGKTEARELQSRIAEMAEARDAAQKQANDRHAELQRLSQRTAELENHVGEVDEQLKKARADAGKTQARAAELERRIKDAPSQDPRVSGLEAEAASLRKQLDQALSAREASQRDVVEARRRLDETPEELKKLREERDRAKADAGRAKLRAADLERRSQELSTQAARVAGLEAEVAAIRRKHDESKEEFQKLQELRNQAKEKAELADARVAGLAKDASRVVGLEDEIGALRRQLDESKKELQEFRDQTKEKAGQADARAAGLEQEAATLRRQLGESGEELKKLKAQRDQTEEKSGKSETRLAGLEQETTALRRQLEESRGELKQSQENRDRAEKEIAQLRTQTAELKRQVERAEAKSSEANRYFESLEKELLEAREGEAEGAKLRETGERLRAEIGSLKESRREQQEWLEELGQTVIDLEHKLEKAESGMPAPPAEAVAPAPTPRAIETPSTPIASIFDPEPPPRPPEPVAAASAFAKAMADGPAPGAPPVREPDKNPTPASVASTIPPSQAIPGPSSSPETTLRPQHSFGPVGADGQPVYVLHELLPPDPLGVVYRASERASGRQFAVRFIAGQAGEEQTQAIEREVEKLIALPHPNILHVQGSGRRKNRLYLAMDLVQAPTLARAKIHDLRKVCAILRDVAGAVHYAHEEGLFHGDLNPENIVVARDADQDHPLVKDFELGYLLETLLAPPASGKEARSSLRNVAYLPPEQINEARPKLTVAGDVYGLGATLYAALTDRAPFEGKDLAQVRTRVMFEEPTPLLRVRSDVPEPLAAIVRRAMVKESGLRYGTAQQMADALTKFLDVR